MLNKNHNQNGVLEYGSDGGRETCCVLREPGAAWDRRGKAPSRQTLPAQSMTVWSILKRGRDSARLCRTQMKAGVDAVQNWMRLEEFWAAAQVACGLLRLIAPFAELFYFEMNGRRPNYEQGRKGAVDMQQPGNALRCSRSDGQVPVGTGESPVPPLRNGARTGSVRSGRFPGRTRLNSPKLA